MKYLFLFLFLISCSDRQRINPFDSKALNDHDHSTRLACVAGDGYVDLEWNLTRYRDIEGYNLLRRPESMDQWQVLNDSILSQQTTYFRDEHVENGQTYEYSLSLFIENEGEKNHGKAQLATPGPEIIWLADKGSGFIWKISPDGRSAHFARGQFLEINDLGINVLDGSCWFVDGASSSVSRIDIDGGVESFPTDLGTVVDIEIDGEEGLGWILDMTQRKVFSFDLSIRDSLELIAVDANFDQPSGLASFGGSCWIVDGLQKRILLYSHSNKKKIEFSGIDRPSAIFTDSSGDGWVIIEGGKKIIRLKSDGTKKHFNLPFFGALGISGNVADDFIWLFSKNKLFRLSTKGDLLREWVDLPQVKSIAVEKRTKAVWVAMGQKLWKIGDSYQIMSTLSGFSNLGKIVVSSR